MASSRSTSMAYFMTDEKQQREMRKILADEFRKLKNRFKEIIEASFDKHKAYIADQRKEIKALAVENSSPPLMTSSPTSNFTENPGVSKNEASDLCDDDLKCDEITEQLSVVEVKTKEIGISNEECNEIVVEVAAANLSEESPVLSKVTTNIDAYEVLDKMPEITSIDEINDEIVDYSGADLTDGGVKMGELIVTNYELKRSLYESSVMNELFGEQEDSETLIKFSPIELGVLHLLERYEVIGCAIMKIIFDPGGHDSREGCAIVATNEKCTNGARNKLDINCSEFQWNAHVVSNLLAGRIQIYDSRAEKEFPTKSISSTYAYQNLGFNTTSTVAIRTMLEIFGEDRIRPESEASTLKSAEILGLRTGFGVEKKHGIDELYGCFIGFMADDVLTARDCGTAIKMVGHVMLEWKINASILLLYGTKDMKLFPTAATYNNVIHGLSDIGMDLLFPLSSNSSLSVS